MEETGSTADPRGKQRRNFRAPQEPFTASDFSYGKLLGLGSYSKVVKATKKDTGMTYALKIMDKLHIVKENKTAYVKLERIVLDQLDHPGIIRLFFTFQDVHYLYMGLECCENGELFDQIQRKKKLSSEEARFYASELIDVMEYLHGEGLIHRDLKPENLLLTKDGHLKVADFGSAKALETFSNGLIQNLPDDKSCALVGTAEYVSPEVLNGQPITTGVDLWALGCIIYQMLVGRPPFKCVTEYLTFQKVMNRDFTFPDYLSPEAKDLIDRLLDLDPKKRLGAGSDGYATLKAHPFFHGIQWSEVRKTASPPVAPPQTSGRAEDGSTSDHDDDENDDGDDVLDNEWAFAHIGMSSNPFQRIANKLGNLNLNESDQYLDQTGVETNESGDKSPKLSDEPSEAMTGSVAFARGTNEDRKWISSIKSKMSLLDKFQKFFFKLVKANVGYEKKNNASVKC